MDYVDWIMYVSGGAFGLLTLGLGLSRVSAFTERDVNPVWWLGFIVFGSLLAATLILDWFFPIEATIYLANGGAIAREVHMETQVVCIPPKSYDSFRWRLGAPDTVIVKGANNEHDVSYKVGHGAWFINTSQSTISAEMFDTENSSVDREALLTRTSGAIHIDSRYGKAYRMFSQSSFDRVYSAQGDILEASQSGPCASSSAADKN